jgi:hypothetical protein
LGMGGQRAFLRLISAPGSPLISFASILGAIILIYVRPRQKPSSSEAANVEQAASARHRRAARLANSQRSRTMVAQRVVNQMWKSRMKRPINAIILFLACGLATHASAGHRIPIQVRCPCSLDPSFQPPAAPYLTFAVPARHLLQYTERTGCLSLTPGTFVYSTYCFTRQSGSDSGNYRCGPNVPTGCVGLDLFQITGTSYTANGDGTTTLCVTARNTQPDNDRYVSVYFGYLNCVQTLPVKKDRPQD